MTKYALLAAASVVSFAAPAFADYAMPVPMQHGHQQTMTASNDPCVLGTYAQPGACVGPVRVAPMVMSQGGVSMAGGQIAAPTSYHGGEQRQRFEQAQAYGQSNSYSQSSAYSQSQDYSSSAFEGQTATYVNSAPANQQSYTAGYAAAPVAVNVASSTNYSASAQPAIGCVPGYSVATVPCNGYWVPAPQPMPQPVPAPMPQPQPEPIYYTPPPAPIFMPQPQQVGMIPTSFFTGGASYGVGYGVEQVVLGYGGSYSGGGGTRFSGVRERSPTPLVPPSRKGGGHGGGKGGGGHGGGHGGGGGCGCH